MKTPGFVLITILCTLNVSGQEPMALDDRLTGPGEQYRKMKAKALNYQSYKVIQENVMDEVWNSTLDTLQKVETEIVILKNEIRSLQSQLTLAQIELKEREETLSSMIFTSENATILGFIISKRLLLFLSLTVVAVFVVSTIWLLLQTRAMRLHVKECDHLAAGISQEFDEFRRKTIEKQARLSRELQNEKNKAEQIMREKSLLV